LRLSNSEVLRHTERYLELLSAGELSLEEKQAFIRETVENYTQHYNRGFITYRKSVTEAGQFAAIEWSGSGSILKDILDREYIDCLGGYGIFSAGVNHPKIVKAVTDQMARMALNSQELLEPWRGALARVLAEVTPGELQNSFFINNGTDAIEGAIKLARLHTKAHTFISTLSGFHGKTLGSLSLMGKASFREPFQHRGKGADGEVERPGPVHPVEESKHGALRLLRHHRRLPGPVRLLELDSADDHRATDQQIEGGRSRRGVRQSGRASDSRSPHSYSP